MSRPIFAGILGRSAQNMQWIDDANCKNMDVNLFFPDIGQNIPKFVKEVCGSCDVIRECMWYANETGCEDGVFAGMSPRQRLVWRREWGVELGMSEEAWVKTRQANRLRTSVDEWDDNERPI